MVLDLDQPNHIGVDRTQGSDDLGPLARELVLGISATALHIP